MRNEIIFDALSLGFGVQSTGLAFMCGMDMLPRPDKIYFSDLRRESKEVYDYIEYATPILKGMGIEIVTVTPGDIWSEITNFKEIQESGGRHIMIPLWFRNPITGKRQPLRRQCTSDYKIEPIARQIRKDLNMPRLSANTVRIWQGISYDEESRVSKLYPDGFRVNHYPFISKFANITYPNSDKWLTMTREMIKEIVFKKNGFKIPPKSSCFFCPFHDIEYWFHIYVNYPAEWILACQLDELLRDFNYADGSFENGPFYLYEGLIPLKEIDFEKELEIFRRDKAKGLFSGCDSGFCYT